MAAIGILINIASHERPVPIADRRRRRPPGERRRYALVAGGGTAGHLQPALAIAEALVDAGPRPRQHRIRRIGAGPGPGGPGGTRVPLHAAAGTGHRPEPRAAELWRNLGAVTGLAVAVVRAFGLVARARPAGGGVGRGVRQPAGLVGRRGPRGAPGAGQRGCRARCGQPAARPVRPGQRRRLAGEPAAPVGGHRHAGAPGDRRRRPGRRRPPAGPAVAGHPAGPTHGGGVRRLARRPADQRGRRRIWSTVGRTGTTGRSTRSSAGGTGTTVAGAAGPDAEARPADQGLAWSGCPTRSGWTWCTRAADLVVCRAGAMTVAELAVAGVPSVLVPAARGSGGPPDGQRPGARAGRGARSSFPTPSATRAALATVARRAARRPDPARGHGPGGAGRWAGPTPPAAGARVVEANARPAPAGRRHDAPTGAGACSAIRVAASPSTWWASAARA